jgi:hypothetical protein
MPFHDNDTMLAVLSEAKGKIEMLLTMNSHNFDHAVDHKAWGFVEQDGKLHKRLTRALEALNKCQVR